MLKDEFIDMQNEKYKQIASYMGLVQEPELVTLYRRKYISQHRYPELINRNIIIFGCGKNGLELKKQLEIYGCHIEFFVDNNKNNIGSYVDGIKVISPQDSIKIINAVYLITIMNPHSVLDVYRQLKDLGVAQSDINVTTSDFIFA